MATGGSKATFTSYEITDSGEMGSQLEVFTVQFNPKEIKTDKASKWKKKDEQGADGAAFEYQQGEPRTLVMDLFFDTSMEQGSGPRYNVEWAWVEGLLALTNLVGSGGGGGQKKHPPMVKFVWGDFEFVGIVDKIATQYLMFSSDGNPIRAKCNLSMKEYKVAEFLGADGGDNLSAALVDLSGGAGTIATRDLTVITAQVGDTAASLAAENGTTFQAVCEENNIDDPTADLAGQEIVIPSGSDVAGAHQTVTDTLGDVSGAGIPGVSDAADALGDEIPSAADVLDAYGSGQSVYNKASDLF
jgi:hypothetical protein